MKRHHGLRQLSSDHHRALVLAKRLRDISDTTTADERLQAAGAMLGQWQDEVAPHFCAEEEYLLPLLARFTQARQPEIVETQTQHVAMRAQLDEIRAALEAGLAPETALLHRLGDALHAHVRYEESILFPVAEDALPAEQLARLARLLGH